MANFSLKEPNNHYKANLTQDLGLDAWDINLLIFFVENTFNIRFNQGIEKDVSNLKELALMVQQKTANKEYNAA
ncbi:MAG: hypothetical protein R6V16_08700 [Bacteroidales bacterium]